MSSLVVADASCLIGLDNIGKLDLLPQLFSHVLIPPAVQREFGGSRDFLEVREAKNEDLIHSLAMMIGAGESEAIALALEEHCPVILDDKKARGIAEGLSLHAIGTVGILIKAKQAGLIPSIRVALDELQNVAFYISQAIRNEALKLCSE